ncbi:hypothetical protein BDP55DRAFT_770620 [Colletotrichum godetiae]|uniref:Uncharacterized protein n=1 Tax=Colletotrichum godetiae TaxID=1209918 RepID=A0AAJ0ESY9_9PEZI|nr:uncharacterized protein BDP55DRAFT_770620 [Colletotrichum godetiae]KAK1672803.1 hypothetical protein BDP55DRAFT_770620 [Colletotrichum godetiae]
MSAPRRSAYEAFAAPIDHPRRIAQPFPHDYQRGQREARAQEKTDNSEKIVGETAKMAETLTEGASQTQCVFSDEDIIPGTSIAGVSGRLGDAKLVSMQRMVMDSVPEGSQVKIIYIISKKENDNNGQVGAANNAAAAEAGPADNDRIVLLNNAVKDRIRAQIRQRGGGQADEDDEEDGISQRPRKRLRLGTPFLRVSRRAMAPMHVSPGDVKAEEDEDEENSVKHEGENLEEHDEENGEPSQQQGIPGFALLSPAEMLATARRERLMHGEEQIKHELKEEVDEEVKEENDAEALFFSIPNEVIYRFSRSHPSLRAMGRETRSLYRLPSSFPSPARPAHTAHQNNISDNDNGDDDNNEEQYFQTRYAGVPFDEFLAGHAGPFLDEDPYPLLRSLNDGTDYHGYH